MAFLPIVSTCFLNSFGSAVNDRKGVVVHGDGHLWVGQFHSFYRIRYTHGKIVAYRQQHIIEWGHLADQFHVVKKTGIAGVIQ